MILNDLALQDQTVAAWVAAVDARLEDATGHRMLAYGDELLVERRGKQVWLRVPWAELSRQLEAMRFPDSPFAEPVDGTDFYLDHVAALVRDEFRRRHPTQT